MSNTIVTIKNGHITNIDSKHIYADLGQIRDEYFIANRWIGRKYLSGDLVFSCKDTNSSDPDSTKIYCKIYSDGYIKFFTTNGLRGRSKVVWQRRLADSIHDVNGELLLGGGTIASRKVFFRESSYSDFMKDHRIDYLVRDNPNKIYQIPILDKRYSYSKYSSWAIFTDGQKKYVEYGNVLMVEVSNASWVVECTKNSVINNVVITTESDIRSLQLPVISYNDGFFGSSLNKCKKILWFSRHTLENKQLTDFNTDISICQINKTVASAKNIGREIEEADILAIVANINLEKQFLELANGKPVIMSEFNRDRDTDQFYFVKWKRIVSIDIKTEDIKF